MADSLSATQKYRINQINNASPLELIILAYDAALMGCRQCDLERTTKALSVLRNALNFNYDNNFAMGLLRLYQYCSDLARKGKYDEAAHYLREVRNVWVQALEQNKSDESPLIAAQISQPAMASLPSQLLVA